jgi:hypothetical protein
MTIVIISVYGGFNNNNNNNNKLLLLANNSSWALGEGVQELGSKQVVVLLRRWLSTGY